MNVACGQQIQHRPVPAQHAFEKTLAAAHRLPQVAYRSQGTSPHLEPHFAVLRKNNHCPAKF